MKAKKLAEALQNLRLSLDSLDHTLVSFQERLTELDEIHNDFCQILELVQDDVADLQDRVDKELEGNGNKRF